MKLFSALLLTSFSFIACQQSTQTFSAAANNEKLVARYFDHFNRHQWEEMANLYTEVAAFKDPSLGPGVVKQTRQQTKEKYAKLNEVFPDLHDEIIQTYPSGDKHIVVEFISSGTGPDSVTFSLPICTILTVENGLITQDFTYFDNFEEEAKR